MAAAWNLRRRARLQDSLHTLGMAGVLAIAASVPLVDIYRTWAGMRAEKAAWDGITGPACPTAEAPSPKLVGRRPLKDFTYGDVTFERRHGHASCAGFRDDGEVYRICQFNAPSVLRVTTPKGTVVFEPGPVRPTTVTIRDGVATCVLGGWFRS
ncbi:hypothetical protein [Phenylobacterium sp.]|uniref:hypothetical protein n=1 Tax=Phenylobacterium sp. TaxID=1871053 RepID=UPI00281240FB|nr:hypothetical protein [Phenylobacterium sp.]